MINNALDKYYGPWVRGCKESRRMLKNWPLKSKPKGMNAKAFIKMLENKLKSVGMDSV